MDVGDEWIYRKRPYSPSERLRIIGSNGPIHECEIP
jgi:hypothetical protein